MTPARGLSAIARSASFRFAALVFILQLLSAGAILATVRQLILDELLGDSRALSVELRDDLLSTYGSGGDAALAGAIRARLVSAGNADTVLLLARADGQPVAGNLGAWPPNITPGAPWRTIDLFRVGSARPERMELVSAALPGGDRLLAGHVVENSLKLNRVVEAALLSALLLALPLALIGAWAAARLIDGRLRNIAATARAVGGGDLSHRVVPDGSGDAFEAVGLSINAMLERIEALVSELRIVTDGLAHDLRSPLTRLKATLERALGEARDSSGQTALATALSEADTLLTMLSTALQISRAEAGIGRDRFAITDLTRMLGDLVEMYGPLVEERGLTIAQDPGAPLLVPVHRELLGQAVANLVDNAVKYGAGHIQLAAAPTADGAEIVIADGGQGIPAERRAEAVRRFGRLDAARHVGGAGLGLALVAAVARLHGGTLTLEDNGPGLRVRMTLAA
ncbi:HAMP domain-containing sensor histidine kinase [Sphingomonas flavalba]|uniref:HAMP domain-containing sensor histidine kinase n=1 Tax=Sphingomonas flavalba TaxID=2559804 RepID=UPI001EF05144|nr:HAMP domain-containing sensor histidine kinase [Sphingomonas flavalba]